MRMEYDEMGCCGFYYFDLDGNPIERTPQTHPYSYEEFVVFKSQDFKTDDIAVYHDRMLQWTVMRSQSPFVLCGRIRRKARCSAKKPRKTSKGS